MHGRELSPDLPVDDGHHLAVGLRVVVIDLQTELGEYAPADLDERVNPPRTRPNTRSWQSDSATPFLVAWLEVILKVGRAEGISHSHPYLPELPRIPEKENDLC